MSSEQRDFAQRALEAFAASGHHTDQEVGDAGGPSSTTMTTLRKLAAGDMEVGGFRSDTLRRIDAAAGWIPGTAKNLWMYGDAEIKSYSEPTPGRRIAYPSPSDPRQADDYVREVHSRLGRIEERLERIELLLLKGGYGHGDSLDEKSDIGPQGRTRPRRMKTSDLLESVDPAADDVRPDGDEEPGGSD